MKRAASICIVVLLSISMTACSASQANKTEAVIEAIINVAKAETPLIPVADQAAYTNYLTLATTLDSQLGTCIVQASGIMSTSGKISACFTVFAEGLTSPQELALLRVLNANTQSKLQLYIGGIIAAVNVIVAFTTPQIAPTPASAEEMHGLGLQVGLTPHQMAVAGF